MDCHKYIYYCFGSLEVFSAKERATHWSGLWFDIEDMGE
jgi:hypothetical protein